MTKDTRLHMLMAARSIIDALLTEEVPTEEACTHPKELRTDLGGFGKEKWVCACGYEETPDA